jgi:hypothetical protein
MQGVLWLLLKVLNKAQAGLHFPKNDASDLSACRGAELQKNPSEAKVITKRRATFGFFKFSRKGAVKCPAFA